MSKYFSTAESVGPGHPDKVMDFIADSILDAIFKEDPNSRVAIDGVFKDKFITLGGEITTEAKVDYEKIVKESLFNLGYEDLSKNVVPTFNIFEQSPDIALGTNDEVGGAGDQGTITGYATSETSQFIPLDKLLADEVLRKLYFDVRPNYSYIGPDMKSQVTLLYTNGVPNVHTVVVACQHDKDYNKDEFKRVIRNTIMEVISENKVSSKDVKIIINGTGEFTIGGPEADSGEVGRKIVVDAYGVSVPVGGGAFSGKDPTKVDRSAAYYARYVAKNIVAADLAKECLITVSYCIGLNKPISVKYDFRGTERIDKELIENVVNSIVDFSPRNMIETLRLRRPLFATSGIIGHFGKQSKLGLDFTTWVPIPWEQLDLVDNIKVLINNNIKGGN